MGWLKKFLAEPDSIPDIPVGMLDYHQKVAHTPPPIPVWPTECHLTTAGEGYGFQQFIPQEERKDLSMKFDYEQFANYLEHLLSFHSFLKYGGSLLSSGRAGIKKYQRSVLSLLDKTKKGISRGPNTMQFRIQKFLECSHFGKDHLMFGPPVASNSAVGESGLKTLVKQMAITAQKRGDDIFKGQLARNLSESFALNQIHTAYKLREEELREEETTNSTTGVSTFGRNFCYLRNRHSLGVYAIEKNNKGIQIQSERAVLAFPDCVLYWFDYYYGKYYNDKVSVDPNFELRIQLVTEMTIHHNNTGLLLRTHPDYRGEGAWFDFVKLRFEYCDGPARCACFFVTIIFFL